MHAEPELTLASTYHPCNQAVGLLRGHVAAALRLLSAAKPSSASIHAARQELKRARAMLRLVRESIDPDQFRSEDTTLQQAAQQLNDIRDAEVALRVFNHLRTTMKDAPRPPKLEPLRKLLLQERRASTASGLRSQLAGSRALLVRAKERTRDWSVANDLELLTQGMQRTYRKGRDSYRAALESRTDECLHAWRRQLKYSAYQLEALGSLAPARMAKRLRRSTKLARLLGRDHDLLLLQARIADAQLDAACKLHLAAAIRRERSRLQRRALRLGKRLYRDKPRSFQPFN